MSAHQSYEEQKALVVKGLVILGVITIFEVLFALLAKGHLVHGVKFATGFGHYLYMAIMVGASFYKAYYIVFNFMHMAYEVRGLMLSVLVPMLLLVWAIIAFFQEGTAWGKRREQIREKNEEVVKPSKPAGVQGMYHIPGTSLKG